MTLGLRFMVDRYWKWAEKRGDLFISLKSLHFGIWKNSAGFCKIAIYRVRKAKRTVLVED